MFTLVNYFNTSEILLLKYFVTHFLKHCIMGSLTGAVASKRVTEAHKGEFKLNRLIEERNSILLA